MDKISRIFNLNNIVAVKLRICVPILFLCFIGLLALKSTSIDTLGEHSVFYKQFVWIGIGVLVFIFIQFTRNQLLYEFAYIFYFLILFLLIITLFMPIIKNSTRWIVVGGFQFQPSEIGKIVIILAMARFLADYKDVLSDQQLILSTGIIALLPLMLVFKQPDYGTGIMYLLPVLPMLYWSGVKVKNILLYIFPIISMIATYSLIGYTIWMFLLIIMLISFRFKIFTIIFNFIINIGVGLFAVNAYDNLLNQYHRNRIYDYFQNLFLGGSDSYMGIGYQAFQSKVAIGSGGFFGKGLGEGTQSYLRFLPIKDSDFIVSVISEELGLFFILLIIITFMIFVYNSMDFAQRIFNKFYSLSIIGFASILFFHIIINMSMITGLFPVVCLHLPFIIYGGSFMLTCFIIISIINNIINNEL